MRKRVIGLILTTVITTSCILAGCINVDKPAKASGEDKEFVFKNINNGDVMILLDKTTGIEYIVVYNSKGGVGITPRYSNIRSDKVNRLK